MAKCDVNLRGEEQIPNNIISTGSLFDPYKTAKYNKLTQFIVGDIFRKFSIENGWTPNDLTDPDNLQKFTRALNAYFNNILDESSNPALYPNSLFTNMSEDVFLDIDENIIPNFDIFISEFYKDNPIIVDEDFEIDLDEFYDNEDFGVSDESENAADSVSQDEIEDSEGKEARFDKQGNEVAPIRLASKQVKTIIRLAPKSVFNLTTGQVEIFKTNDGIPTVTDLSTTFNLLLDRLANTKDFDEFVAKFSDSELLKVVPEAQFIAESLKLNKPGSQLSPSEHSLIVDFYTTFSKPKIQVQSATTLNDGRFSVYDEISGNSRHILVHFTSNFQLGRVPDNMKQYITKDPLRGYSITRDKYPPKPITFKDRLDFLGLLGMTFSDTTISSGEDFQNVVAEAVDAYLYTAVKKRLDEGQELRDPVTQMRSPYSPIIYNEEGEMQNSSLIVPGEARAIDSLIAFEGKYSKFSPSLSTRNINGELQNLISLDNQLSIVVYHLNNAKTLKELYKTSAFGTAKFNPLFSKSHIINFLFDNDGNKNPDRTISLSNLSGYKNQKGKKTTAKLERDLSAKDKLIQDFKMMLLAGRTDIIRTETSNSFFNISLQDNGKTRPYFAINAFLNNFKSSSYFRRMTHKYLTGELERVKSYPKKKQENPTLPNSYGEFTIFYETMNNLAPDVKEAIMKAGKNLDINSDEFSKLLDEYDKELSREVELFKTTMNDLGITMDDLTKDSIRTKTKNTDLSDDSLIRAFVANTNMQNIEFTIMFSGDPLFFEDSKGLSQFHKRTKGLSSTGTLASIIDLIEEYRKSPYEKMFYENYSASGALGVKYKNHNKVFNTQIIEEFRVRPSFAYLKPSMAQDIFDSIMKRDGFSRYSLDEIKNKILGEANSQKPADGQGYVSLDFHRELAQRFAFYNKNMEVAYMYEGLILRRDILKQPLTEIQEKELERLEKLIFTNPNKYALPVIKMTYWGGINNSTVDAKAFDKFSTVPLLPSDVRNMGNETLSNLLLDMTKSQVGYVKYESGTKVFKSTPIDMSKLTDSKHDEFYTELLKLQITPHSDQKVQTAIPTQLLKLILSNSFDSGKPISDSIKNLYDTYINTLKGIQKVQTENLFNDLGITREGVVDMSKLSKRLVEQAKSQGQNANVIEALQVSDNKFVGALEQSGFVTQVIDLVSGIADKKLRRFQVPGGDYVLVTNANRSELNFYKYGPDGTTACDCRITLNGEFIKLLNLNHPDGNPIGTIERLNGLLKKENWRKEHVKELTVILDRVPTQGVNSMDVGIVKEFLTPTLGNVVIMPDEIVYKSGTDFDYDKEKVITPSFNQYGIYYSDANEEKMMQRVKDIEDEYREILEIAQNYSESEEWLDDPSSVDNFLKNVFKDSTLDIDLGVKESLEETAVKIKEYFSFKNSEYNKHTNSIVETYSNILLQPEMFAELVIPNSTRNLKPIAERIGSNLGRSADLPKKNRIFSHIENLRVKSIFFDSKNMLAPFAVDNVYMQLIEYQGVKIKDNYLRPRKNGPWAERQINHVILSKDEENNIKTGDSIDISLREDLDGYLKQHWDSETINATVDAGKDPWFALLGINRQNIGVVNFMKAMGYPINKIINFINQPILRKLYEVQQNGMSQPEALLYLFSENVLDIKNITFKEGRINPNQLSEFRKKNEVLDIEEVDNKLKVKYAQKSALSIPRIYNLLKTVDEGVTPQELKYKFNTKDFNIKISEQDLKDNLENSDLSSNQHNVKTLSHFIMMNQHNQAFSNFRYFFNFDRVKVSTPTDVKNKDDLRKLIIHQGLYSENTIIDVEQNSIISPFINTETYRTIYDNLFDILGSTPVQETMSELYKDYNSNFNVKNARNLRNLPKVLNEDFITALIFNYNIENNQSFISRNRHLIIKEGNKRTMGERLELLREQPFYDDLRKQFPILDNLQLNTERVTSNDDLNGLKQFSLINNIQLIKPNSDAEIESAGIINQFKELEQFEFTGYGDQNETYTRALHRFMEDLYTAGIVQSGFSKTFVGFSEYIPTSFRRNIFTNALNNFRALSSAPRSNFLEKFKQQFKYNNRRYFPQIVFADETVKNNDNNYSSRLKLYDNRLNYMVANVNTEGTEVAKPETPKKDIVIPIQSITRSQKATKFNVTLPDGTVQEKQGYKISVKEYPDFEAYLVGTSKTGFSVELPSGRSIPVNAVAIKNILPELTDILNTWAKNSKNLEKLRSVGLFVIKDQSENQKTQDQINKCLGGK